MRLHPDTHGEDSVCEVKGSLLPLGRLDSGLGHISESEQGTNGASQEIALTLVPTTRGCGGQFPKYH